MLSVIHGAYTFGRLGGFLGIVILGLLCFSQLEVGLDLRSLVDGLGIVFMYGVIGCGIFGKFFGIVFSLVGRLLNERNRNLWLTLIGMLLGSIFPSLLIYDAIIAENADNDALFTSVIILFICVFGCGVGSQQLINKLTRDVFD